MNPVLQVQNLRKVYHRGGVPFVAVDGISFELKPGEILGLLGANGAGKTTTIQMLLSTLTYTSGSIMYFGKDLLKHRSEVLGQIAFASTYVSLPWNLTICENLEVFGYLYSLSRRQIKERMDPLLKRFGIFEKKHVPVSNLSSGQITRLILVKAFLIEPKIILLDEPTASLDPDVAHEVCDFLLSERDRRGLSILFTSHKMDEVAELCDRVLFLQKGKIVANDLPENLAQTVSKCRLQLVVSEGMEKVTTIAIQRNLVHKLEHRFIEIEIEETLIPEFLNLLAHTDIKYSQIRIVEPTLEDYFLKMVGKR